MRYRGDPSRAHWQSGAGRILDADIRANRIQFDVEVSEAGRLAVHDAYWDGWRARIDDAPAAIHPAGLWRAVDLTSGRHTLTMTYRPPSIPTSLFTCALGFVILGVFLWPRHRRVKAKSIP